MPIPKGPLVAQMVKNLPAMQETWVWTLEASLEKEMATHSSILPWRIPWTEEPGGLQSMGLQSQTRLKRLGTQHSSNWNISKSATGESLTSHPRNFFHSGPCASAKLFQSRLTLCNPMDCNPPGFSVHGIFQARILEWVAISFSKGSSWGRDWTCMSYISCIGRCVLYH